MLSKCLILSLITLCCTTRPLYAAAPESPDRALLRAAEMGELNAVDEALKAGARIDFRDEHRRTALYRAAAGGHIEVIDALISHHADPNIASDLRWGAPVAVAVASHHREAALRLLRAGGDPRKVGDSRVTCLHAAAWIGDVGLVKLFMEKGIPWDATAPCDGTVLHEAASADQVEVIRFLLNHKADVNVRAGAGFTPLMVAAQYDRKAAIAALLAGGADPRMTNDGGRTALQLASMRHSQHAIEILSRAGH